jgi:coatomer protein complex subunit gamma
MAKIIDPTMLIQMERFIKVAIVDSNDHVSSAAIFLGLKLCRSHPEVVKKWVTEVQEKLNSKNPMIQYHAMLLLYEIKKNDPLALSKFFEAMMSLSFKSPIAQTQLIRLIRTSLKTYKFEGSMMFTIERYLSECLKKSQDMVVYEASKTICELSESMQNSSGNTVASALAVLPLFLVSSKVTTKFAGIKTLNTNAIKHANYLVDSAGEFESLLTEPNRSLATMAISTLLKLSTESNVEKLLTQISSFMAEVTDDFKIELIESIKILCLRMPQKYRVLIKFVGEVLKDEGGLQLKTTIFNILVHIFNTLQVSSDDVLFVLAEFIEDCSYENLQQRVIYFLGEHGPASKFPSRLIRFIYNRLIIEKPSIRAAAVSALFKFAKVEDLTKSTRTLIEKCLEDKDDEVRERAKFYLECLDSFNFQKPCLPVPIYKIEKILAMCKESGNAFSFDVKVTEAKEEKKVSSLPEQVRMSMFNNIPELDALGAPVKSGQFVSLTEKNAEFIVSFRPHYFAQHLVVEFQVKNTLGDISLSNVAIHLHVDGTKLEDYSESLFMFPCPEIGKNGEGTTFIQMSRPSNLKKVVVPATMKYKVSEYQNDTILAVFDDEYQVENIHLDLA